MPFTLVHPVAVLPLARPPFVPSALVVGSVAPDLPYVLRTTGIPVGAQDWYEPFVNATTSHTPAGLLLVDLPLALLLYLAWLTARRPLRQLWAPTAATGPTSPTGPTRPPGSASVGRAGWVVVSVVLGACTHLVWDGVTELSALDSPLLGGLTWGRAVNHASTVVGLLVLGALAWRARARLLGPGGTGTGGHRTAAVAVVAACAATGAVLVVRRSWASSQALPTADLVETVLSGAAKGAAAGTAAAVAVTVTVWWVRHAATRAAGT